MPARQRPVPLSDSELLHADELSGQGWKVTADHHGHTMRVVGRIVQGDSPTSMLIVRCSCGDAFRMAEASVRKALHKGSGGASA